MLSLSKFGLSEYAEKTRFWVFKPEYLRNIQAFLFRTFFGNTRHLYEENELTLSSSGRGGGVHGKVSWLIAYKSYFVLSSLY